MDEALGGVRKALEIASQWPDVDALILGTLIGYTFTVMVETYFLPTETDAEKVRKQKGLTWILCWLSSGAASSILWRYLDPADRRTERIVISYLVSIISFAAYPAIGRVITHFIPSVGSAWAPRDHEP